MDGNEVVEDLHQKACESALCLLVEGPDALGSLRKAVDEAVRVLTEALRTEKTESSLGE